MDDDAQSAERPQAGFVPPPITNPPRQQIFGSPSNNASPTIPDFSFDDLQLDGADRDGGQDDGNDPKRRRIARVHSARILSLCAAI